METRDLNPEATKPEVSTTPASPVESLESQSIADAGLNLAEAQAAAADKAQFNVEAEEAALADKAFPGRPHRGSRGGGRSRSPRRRG